MLMCAEPKLYHVVRQADVRLSSWNAATLASPTHVYNSNWHLTSESEVMEGRCELKGLKEVTASWPLSSHQ